jgi:hypothetical protein
MNKPISFPHSCSSNKTVITPARNGNAFDTPWCDRAQSLEDNEAVALQMRYRGHQTASGVAVPIYGKLIAFFCIRLVANKYI